MRFTSITRSGGLAACAVVLTSAVIAAGALLFHYAHVDVPLLKATNVFDALAIAYVVLFAGVVVRGL